MGTLPNRRGEHEMSVLQLFQPRRSRSISLTALIDVVFILLLFFMLSSTFSRWRAIDFQAMPTSTGASESVRESQVAILGETGSLNLHDSSFSISSFDDLTEEDVHSFDTAKTLLLLTEANVTVQTIVSAVERLNEIGLERVTFGGSFPEEPE